MVRSYCRRYYFYLTYQAASRSCASWANELRKSTSSSRFWLASAAVVATASFSHSFIRVSTFATMRLRGAERDLGNLQVAGDFLARGGGSFLSRMAVESVCVGAEGGWSPCIARRVPTHPAPHPTLRAAVRPQPGLQQGQYIYTSLS